MTRVVARHAVGLEGLPRLEQQGTRRPESVTVEGPAIPQNKVGPQPNMGVWCVAQQARRPASWGKRSVLFASTEPRLSSPTAEHRELAGQSCVLSFPRDGGCGRGDLHLRDGGGPGRAHGGAAQPKQPQPRPEHALRERQHLLRALPRTVPSFAWLHRPNALHLAACEHLSC